MDYWRIEVEIEIEIDDEYLDIEMDIEQLADLEKELWEWGFEE